MVSDEPRIRSYVLSGFIHTHDVNPVHGADFASQVVHAGLGGAWAGFIYGGAATWYRTPGLRTILGGALKGAGWFGGLGAAWMAGTWFSANKIRDTEDNFNAAAGGALVGLFVGASTLSPNKAVGFPLLFGGISVFLQNVADTLLSNSIARKYENPTPSQKGMSRPGFWAWPKSPAQVNIEEFK